jgi:hypothetical protein
VKLTRKSLDSRIDDAQRKSDSRDDRQLSLLGTIQNKLDENSRLLEVQGTNASRLVERLCLALSSDVRKLMLI